MREEKTICLPRMRSVPQIKAFFAECGEQGLSEREIRRLAKSGKIPSVWAGRKLLVNLDALLEYLSTNTIQPEKTYYGGIRRID